MNRQQLMAIPAAAPIRVYFGAFSLATGTWSLETGGNPEDDVVIVTTAQTRKARVLLSRIDAVEYDLG